MITNIINRGDRPLFNRKYLMALVWLLPIAIVLLSRLNTSDSGQMERLGPSQLWMLSDRFLGQVVENFHVLHFAPELLETLEPALVTGDFLQDGLGTLVIIPEAGLRRAGFEFGYLLSAPLEVKETSGASPGGLFAPPDRVERQPSQGMILSKSIRCIMKRLPSNGKLPGGFPTEAQRPRQIRRPTTRAISRAVSMRCSNCSG